MADAPLVRAQLLVGTAETRAPLDVPLGTQPVRYTLQVPADGLRLPRDVSTLRYVWLLKSSYGDTLTLAQSMSSPQLVRDDSPPTLDWRETRTGDISVRYLDSTPAARDVNAIKQIADDAITRSSLALDTPLSKPLTIYLVPRIFWQGGADFDKTIFISYADREYTGVSLADYISHEGAHALTNDWGNLGAAGGMLAEGIAVYATGGHYQPDLLDQSAARLVQSPLFIPPTILRRDFANQQHEIAYTESGSLVRFLIDQFGLDKFRALMRRPNDWQGIFGKDFDALTQDWLSNLRALNASNDDVRRWQLKVRFYNLLRQYEERFDADARRLPGPDVAKWDAVLRRAMHAPSDNEDNRVLELMLLTAIESIENTRSAAQLHVAETYLADVERKVQAPNTSDDALMADVRAIVRIGEAQDEALLNRDWEALRKTLDDTGAPEFAAQSITRAQAQPAWLRFTQTPAHLVLNGERAWLTIARWAEPLDPSAFDYAGDRWVLVLNKRDGQWRISGRYPDEPAALTAR